MHRKSPILILSLFLITALSACNLPSGSTDATSTPDLAQTLTALADQAQPGSGDAPAQQDTATPQFTATPEFTATPSVPEVTVSTNTNCRTGPGVQYDNIGALLIGQVGTLVGKNSQTGYWIINNPGKTGTCWLYPQYATISGNTANLQEYSIPPTPTPTLTPTFTPTPTLAPPTAVNNPTVAKVCVPLVLPTYNYTGTLNWEDKSDNEDGFNIYLNGGLIGTVGANVVTFPIAPLPLAAGTPLTFGVEAYNSAGKAAIKTVIMVCP